MLRAIVVATAPRFQEEADVLGGRLDCPVHAAESAPEARFYILVGDRLSVSTGSPKSGFTVVVDFDDVKLRQRRQAGSKDLLIRACGLHKAAHTVNTVVDTTAGFGADAWVLAGAGVQVRAYERDRLMYELLEDAHKRMTLEADASNLAFFHGDPALENQEIRADVIYMDPMFSGGLRKALSTKNMMFLQEWLSSEYSLEDQTDVFQWALGQAQNRVVVKRSNKAGFIDQHKPTFQITGKTHRFDVYQRG
jgi:16S rRNA (guanine1516-N2)-methyltransferase